MSADIFARLAARTLGRAEGLVPLAPSRFEPAEAAFTDAPGLEAPPPSGIEGIAAPASDDPRIVPGIPDVRLIADPSPTTHAAPMRATPERSPSHATTMLGLPDATPATITADRETRPLVDPRLRAPEPRDAADLLQPAAAGQPGATVVRVGEQRANAPQAPTAAPPTVIVRIGRVDIHAAPQPVAAAPLLAPVRAPSRPSLADHLQARAEGRR